MDSSIILLCTYASLTAVVTVKRDFQFLDLVQIICKKWQILATCSFRILYAVSDHRNCLLQSDDDFSNMFELAGAYGLSCVDVVIEMLEDNIQSLAVRSDDCIRSFEVGDSSNSSTLEVEEDPLGKFCHHYETVRLSAGWSKLLTHVG